MKLNLINVEDAIFNFKKVYKKYFDDNSLYEIYPQYESDSGEILGFSLFIDPKKNYLVDELPDNFMEVNIFKIIG